MKFALSIILQNESVKLGLAIEPISAQIGMLVFPERYYGRFRFLEMIAKH